ncbi:MAG: TRAP transporter large permease subunit, partial [Rhodobacteraceae bacterium]|nr:TRAP transporter large permease subunit [Paracoccaceae bacterium]
MLFGLDGVEAGLIIVFFCLFAAILSGFPVAFAIGGAGVISFGIIASLDSAGLLIHQAIDTSSEAYRALVHSGLQPDTISLFRYPDLPSIGEPVFPKGWEVAMNRNLSFIVNRMNERVLAGQSIETLLAVLMFVLMGITLERSKIANDLLTSMARVFGPLPGGLAVSIVVVGAFLAASTGIVGATVVTMGLLALPTMLRNNYSPELATGVIAASGTLGQIIPPSIVIVLLGTLAGDLYSAAQEKRAVEAGCTDALTYLGEPAVLSVGTLFQAALLPGIMLAVFYALYAFIYAMLNPDKAPAVEMGASSNEPITRAEGLTWLLAAPIIIVGLAIGASSMHLVGSQDTTISSFSDIREGASLRTHVSDQCKASMITLHGQEAWDVAIAEDDAIEAEGGATESVRLTDEEYAASKQAKIDAAAPIGSGLATLLVVMGIVLVMGRGISPSSDRKPLIIGAIGVLLIAAVDVVWVTPTTTSGLMLIKIGLPLIMALYGCRAAVQRLAKNELIRVVFPPLVLIVAVLGSILGGITNPTPAAALGAGGAIMLPAFRKMKDLGQ